MDEDEVVTNITRFVNKLVDLDVPKELIQRALFEVVKDLASDVQNQLDQIDNAMKNYN